jgi:hypothetical protein
MSSETTSTRKRPGLLWRACNRVAGWVYCSILSPLLGLPKIPRLPKPGIVTRKCLYCGKPTGIKTANDTLLRCPHCGEYYTEEEKAERMRQMEQDLAAANRVLAETADFEANAFEIGVEVGMRCAPFIWAAVVAIVIFGVLCFTGII